jgi:hypothetical protein
VVDVEMVKNIFAADDRNETEMPVGSFQIYEYIDEYLGRKGKDTHINRASAASMCHKRRWYQGHGFEGEKLTPRKIVNFTLGDLTEHTVKYFILKACVGSGKLYSEVDFGSEVGRFTIQGGKEIILYDQEDLTAGIGNIVVTCHVDGWGKRNSDDKWELIEVKSAADYGFERFKESGPDDYLKQAMVSLQTGKAKKLDASEVRFFYLKKNTGHIWDRIFPFDHALANEVAEEYKISNQGEEPKPPYTAIPELYRKKPTGRFVLPWQCGYCPYTAICHPEAALEFKNDKPTYVVKGESL